MSWTVYVISSQKTKRFYKGSCKDLERRVKEHNSGRVKSTKPYQPWICIHTEEFALKADALKRERFLKTRSGYRWLKQNSIT